MVSIALKSFFVWFALTLSDDVHIVLQDGSHQGICYDVVSMLQSTPVKHSAESVLVAEELDPQGPLVLLEPILRAEGVIDATEALHSNPSGERLSDHFVAFYKSSLEAWPHLTNGIVAYLITTLSDTFAQLIQGGFSVFSLQGFDVNRNVALALTASMYNGLILTSWLLKINQALPGFGLRLVMLKLAATQTILQPFVYVPFFFIVHGLFRGQTIKEIRCRIRSDYFALLFRLWSLFMPTRFMMFLIVPVQYQVLWDSTVAFIWQLALSLFNAQNGQDTRAQTTSRMKGGTPVLFKPKADPRAAIQGEVEDAPAVSDAGY